MKLKFYVIVLLMIFIATANTVDAKQSEEFIDFLSNKIYEDCEGEDIIVKEDAILDMKLDIRDGTHFTECLDTRDGAHFIKWSDYNFETIKEILDILNSRGKFADFAVINGEKYFRGSVPSIRFDFPDGTLIKKVKLDGWNILKCGNHILDVNGNDYYWDDQKIELPRNIYNENSFFLFGISLISNGELTLFSFTIFSFSIFGVFTFIFHFIKYSKKIILYLRREKCK